MGDDVLPLTDEELAGIRAMTPPDSHPTILRLLATIDALRIEVEGLRSYEIAEQTRVEVATEQSGCAARCGEPIVKGSRRVAHRPAGSHGGMLLFHLSCFEASSA